MENTTTRFVQEFEKNFDRIRHKNIILYGTGFNTQLLLTELATFRFYGLMDNNPGNIGKEVYGKKVLNFDEVIKSNSIVIIIAKEENRSIIYREIAFLQEKHGMQIFHQNGQLATLSEDFAEIENNDYWNTTIAALKELIERHDIISFDLFDTLAMRKLSKPRDIFAVVERELSDLYGSNFDFSLHRTSAESECIKINPFRYNLDDIYDVFKNMSGLDIQLTEQIKQIEMSTELKYIEPRHDVVAMFDYAKQLNKKLLIISDMYLTSEFLVPLLEKCGITGYDSLLISCEEKLAKADGTIWTHLAAIYNCNRYLHVGDNIEADILEPAKYSIKTYYLMNARQLAQTSSMSSLSANIRSTENMLEAGLVCNRLFNSPFALSKTRGRVAIDDFSTLGYVFFGPLVFNYLIWLINQAKSSNVTKILFCAREGYPLSRLYDETVRLLKIEAPESVYFKTSRRMAISASLKTEQDIYDSLEMIRFYGSFSDFLVNRFGIGIDRDDCHATDIINTLENMDHLINCLKRYLERIIENAATERSAYLKYIKSVYDPNLDNAAISDSGFYGTIQYYLSGITGKELPGFYFCAVTDAANPYNLKYIKGLYHPKESNLAKYLHIFESVMTAPEGMYLKCDADGNFHNAPAFKNQEFFGQKSQIHNGILEFIKSAIELDPLVLNRSPSTEFADKLFGSLVSPNNLVSEEILETFYYDNFFTRNTENRISF